MRRLLTIALATVTTACVTVRSTKLQRGKHLDTTQVKQDVHDVPSLVIEEGVAHVQLARTTCTTWSLTYAQVEQQEIAHPRYGKLGAGAGVMMLGVGLLVAGSKTDAPLSTILTADGVIAGVGGLIATMMFGVGKQIHETRELSTSRQEREEKSECEDTSLAQRVALSWTVKLDGARREGTTGGDGELVVLPAMVDALADVPLATVLKAVALDGGLTFELALGAAPAGHHRLDASDIPSTQWERWATELSSKLPRDRLSRWEGCRNAYGASAAALKCIALTRQDPRITELTGSLAASDGGDYGTSFVFDGKTGEAIVFHATLPPGASDWLAQIIELETGTVIAETFSTTDRLELGASLVRTSSYAVVLDATSAGAFRASLTRVQRRERP